MLQGVDINQRIEFVSKEDKTDPKTVFILKPMSGSQMLDMSKYISGKDLQVSSEYINYMVETSIVEIKNPDITEATKIKEYINQLSSTVLLEVMIRVGEINNVSDDESKN